MREFSEYKEDMELLSPLATGFMIDSLLFKPAIPAKYMSGLEELLYACIEEIEENMGLPYDQDVGSAIPKLISAIARLNFKPIVRKEDIKSSRNLWQDLLKKAKQSTTKTKRYNENLSENEDKLLDDLISLKNQGIEITVGIARADTRIHEWKFEEALEKLKCKGYIYFPENDIIRVLDW